MDFFDVEKRQYNRFPIRMEMLVASQTWPDRQLYGQTIDFSQGGVKFFSLAQFKKREPAFIHFEFDSSIITTKRGLIVRKIEGDPFKLPSENQSIYAFEFDDVFAKEEVETMLFKLPVSL